MNLNRRTAIKRALGIGAAAAALAIAKTSSAAQADVPAMPQATPPIFTPPPADTRTPREVWQDHEKTYNEWLDGILDNSSQYRSWNRRVEHVTGKTYLRLKNKMTARGMKIEELVMGGDTHLVIHGNLYTIGQWW